MSHLYKNIPETLKKRPNWVVWGIQGAPPKAPFYPASILSGKPTPAKANDKQTWGRYTTAVDCVNCGLAQGIGFEFEGNDMYGVDLDHVIDEQGQIFPKAQNVINSLKSYTEISPSGTGIHIFVYAPKANIIRHRKKDFFVEIYNVGRYFTVTGDIYGDVTTISTRTSELQSIHDNQLLPTTTQKMASPIQHSPVTITQQDKFLKIGLQRDKVFASLWAGARRHGNESSDDIALINKLAYWCNGDPDTVIQAFLCSPYYSKKDEAHIKKCQRTDYLLNTATNACSTTYSTAVVDYERYRHKNLNRSFAR